jgi:hypothetical protein
VSGSHKIVLISVLLQGIRTGINPHGEIPLTRCLSIE